MTTSLLYRQQNWILCVRKDKMYASMCVQFPKLGSSFFCEKSWILIIMMFNHTEVLYVRSDDNSSGAEFPAVKRPTAGWLWTVILKTCRHIQLHVRGSRLIRCNFIVLHTVWHNSMLSTLVHSLHSIRVFLSLPSTWGWLRKLLNNLRVWTYEGKQLLKSAGWKFWWANSPSVDPSFLVRCYYLG